ncbi:MAG TPA: dTMP kinase [Spirochaetota bacterium]|nr:dTMP kinase [Spirochaetota bacterium]
MNILKNFIVIEGLDGSGTSTQAKLLSKNIKNSFFTYEPTDNDIGKFIRKILRNEISVDYTSLAYLFAADRNEHLYSNNGIVERCNRGEIVICDRYLFSSFAYQCLNLSFEKVFELNKDFFLPQIVFFLNTSIDECLRRLNQRETTKEIFEKESLQEKILQNYKKAFSFLKKEGFKYYEINGNQRIEQILNIEMEILKKESLL